MTSRNIDVTLNMERFNHVLNLYDISFSELITKLNTNDPKRKNPFTEENILAPEYKIKISVLKKIDKVFSKGITYYIDQSPPIKTNETSIFFRKDTFNSELNLESKKVINFFEERKFSIQNFISNLEMDLNRKLKHYSPSDSSEKSAEEVRNIFDEINKNLIASGEIKKDNSDRQFLRNLIRVTEELNIFVFEHLDHPAKKEKINFDGFFMKPQMIILANQKYYKREIFTLMHELAHYLINDEEIDSNIEENLNGDSTIERWCNDFAYFFLIKDFKDEINKLENPTGKNNFHKEFLEEISNKTKVSVSALYTRMRLDNKISQESYNSIFEKIKKAILDKELREKEERQAAKLLAEENGEEPPFIPPKQVIHSKLFADILKISIK